jgi:subtilase family serine protease
VKEITIHDDREGFLSGDGEMAFGVTIWRCPGWMPLPCPVNEQVPYGRIAGTGKEFTARTGDVVVLNKVVPGVGDSMIGEDTSPAIGFAVYDGYHHLIRFEMSESDGGSSSTEQMGAVLHVLGTDEHGLGLGTHMTRSVREDGTSAGDYTITYEIRRAPLPDIRPVNIQVDDRQGAALKRVCMAVQNAEVTPAGPFEVALRVNNVVPSGGRYSVGGLAGGESTWACVEAALPAGQHLLTAVVDERDGMTEFNERNNLYEQTYVSSATAKPAVPDQADLVLSAIRVNGQEPNGQSDCQKGKNDVAVLVKNGGAAGAEAFAVRLVVNGEDDEAKVKQVAELAAGEEREVRFDDVRLKKGGQQLFATADPQQAVDESTETNNEKAVAATCADD